MTVALTRIASALLLCMAVVPLEAQTRSLGQWYGTIETPRGPFTLAITLRSDDSGLIGEMESVDQQPGQMLALAEVVATDTTLAFQVPAISATYQATWDDRTSRWTGLFRQGAAMPLSLQRGTPPVRQAVPGLDGAWRGSIDRNGVSLRLILRVATDSNGTRVRLDSPDLSAADLVVNNFRRSADTIHFSVPAAAASFDGMIGSDGRSMEGSWRRPGQPEVQVAFMLAQPPTSLEPRRTQWPLKPREYGAEKVTFSNARAPNVSLAGTLTLPVGPGPFPAAILISGSGPQDRDGTMFGHKPFAVLADHLSRHGIAVLRYDDRGVSESSGDHASSTSADFATDAAAAVEYLLTRPEIAANAIGLVGHSEGGIIGPMAAITNADVSFLVLLAAPGTSIPRMLLTQRRLIGLQGGVSAELLTSTEPLMRKVFEEAGAALDQPDAATRIRAVLTDGAIDSLGISDVHRDALVAQFSGPWFRFFLRHEPARTLAEVHVPVLAMGGSLDLQVPSGENLPAIESALVHNDDVTILEMPGLNHFFQPARSGAPSEYADIPETFAPAAMERITRWIGERYCIVPSEAPVGPSKSACAR